MNEARDCSSDPESKSRVGYVLRMYPRFTQTFVVNEILELERQGVGLSILSLRKPNEGQFHESISRVRAKTEYLPEYLFEAPRKIMSAQWAALRRNPGGYRRCLAVLMRSAGADRTDLYQAALVNRWARKRRLNHVHAHFGTHEASVVYLARLLGGPTYSLTLHAFDIFRDNVDRGLLTRKINESRFVVTVSEYNRRFLLDNFAGLDGSKVRVNYNGIDLERFSFNGAHRDPYAVVSVGRLIEKKGFMYLVRAVARLRDRGIPIRCTIVGDGPEERTLRGEIRRLGLDGHVILSGALPQRQVQELLWRARCFVLPCVRAADGNVDALPTVLLEALASGCTCVSTRVSGVPEIIEDGQSGLLVDPGDDEGLAEAMARVLRHTELGRTLAQNGRRRAEVRFDIRQAVGRLRAWFSGSDAQEAVCQGEVQSVRSAKVSRGVSTVEYDG